MLTPDLGSSLPGVFQCPEVCNGWGAPALEPGRIDFSTHTLVKSLKNICYTSWMLCICYFYSPLDIIGIVRWTVNVHMSVMRLEFLLNSVLDTVNIRLGVSSFGDLLCYCFLVSLRKLDNAFESKPFLF